MWGKSLYICFSRPMPKSFLKYVGFASFVILIWDHIDTFPDEVRFLSKITYCLLPWHANWFCVDFSQVEYIWKGRKSTCKCGLYCIIVRCLTDHILIYSHLPFSLCTFIAKFHPPTTLIPLLYSRPPESLFYAFGVHYKPLRYAVAILFSKKKSIIWFSKRNRSIFISSLDTWRKLLFSILSSCPLFWHIEKPPPEVRYIYKLP